MLFLFSVTAVKAQVLVDTKTTVLADFGVDGDAYHQEISLWPTVSIPNPTIDPSFIDGTDDWIGPVPNGNTTTSDDDSPEGSGVIKYLDEFGAYLPEVNKILSGLNKTAELRMNADLYSEPDGNGTWIDAAYIRDNYVSGNNQDSTVFAQSINKNFDDPRSWTFKTGDVPAKTDIIDVFGHLRRAPDPGPGLPTVSDSEYAFLAASTADADGSNHLDFEYYRKKIDFIGGAIVYEDAADEDPLNNINCGHSTYSFDGTGNVLTHGDVLLSVDYQDGGRTAEVTLLAWIDRTEFPNNNAMTIFNGLNDRPFDFVISNDNFTACTNAFDSTVEANYGYAQIKLREDLGPLVPDAVHTQLNNTGTTTAPPWGTIDSGGNLIMNYPTDTFVEIAVNATLLGFDTRSTPGCDSGLGSVMVKSRSSHSWTSSLKDMGGPFDLGDQPELKVEIAGGAACVGDNPVILTADTTPDDPGTYSYAWEYDNNGTWDSAPGPNASSTYEASTALAGTTTYRVLVTRLGGCTATSNEVDVVISGPPGFTPHAFSICENEIEDIEETDLSDYNDNVRTNSLFSVTWYKAPTRSLADVITTIGDIILTLGDNLFYARITNNVTGCYVDTQLTLTIDEQATVSDATDAFCDADQSDTTLSDYDAEVGNGDSVVWYSDIARTMMVTTTGDLSVGSHTFYARVTNSNECYEDAELVITIYAQPDVDDATDAFCDADQSDTTLSDYDAEVGNGDSVVWYSDIARTMMVTTTGDLSVGSHTFYARVTNSNECYEDAELVITINENPSCTAGNDPAQCPGALDINVWVTPTTGDVADYDFEWTGPGAAYLDDTTSPTPVFLNSGVLPGDYYLEVEITNKVTLCSSTCNTTVTIQDCVVDCGTAFGVAITPEGEVDDSISRCFRLDGFSRWGWTNFISDFGTYTLELYQGAGKCDLNKGTYVGTATVTYSQIGLTDEGEVNVVYDMAPGYGLDEVHLYIGCEMYPEKKETPTVAPGQYTFVAGNLEHADIWTSDNATISATGGFYVIAHSVACGEEIPEGSFIPTSPMEHGSFNGGTDADCEVDVVWGKVTDSKVDVTAYPVPYENEVNISYKFEYDTDVNIDIFDLKGALIKRAANTNYMKGVREQTKFDLSHVDDQMLLVRLTTAKGTIVKKIVSSKKQKH
ncbi:T9SS type A sorting domain-containing protein [Aestuariibaculum marinum]|uniref:T9SS type A sorting domain-containing protein n=1 Tax=Aestuariibaculum marinum TaxID=2683592 RepID=A0A8J6Q6V6_9FLAO|nr:T9SS type A sorting domain-containing protein [Aestuariibaculum marinum]MBD0822681.1 T9SS type A sorting domain-containing protein [Aestuariibaculum marinum]